MLSSHPGSKGIDPNRYHFRDVHNSASGTFNAITKIIGQIGEHILHMVRRDEKTIPAFIQAPDRDAEIRMREYLKSLGVPVIPTYRKAENGSIYATDLSNQEKNYVLSWENTSFDEEEIARRSNDDEFAVPVESMEEIFAQAQEIAEKCASAGIYLKNPDALYLIIDKETRDTKVIAGDYKHFEKYNGSYEDIRKMNLHNCYPIFAQERIRRIFGCSLASVQKAFEWNQTSLTTELPDA